MLLLAILLIIIFFIFIFVAWYFSRGTQGNVVNYINKSDIPGVKPTVAHIRASVQPIVASLNPTRIREADLNPTGIREANLNQLFVNKPPLAPFIGISNEQPNQIPKFVIKNNPLTNRLNPLGMGQFSAIPVAPVPVAPIENVVPEPPEIPKSPAADEAPEAPEPPKIPETPIANAIPEAPEIPHAVNVASGKSSRIATSARTGCSRPFSFRSASSPVNKTEHALRVPTEVRPRGHVINIDITGDSSGSNSENRVVDVCNYEDSVVLLFAGGQMYRHNRDYGMKIQNQIVNDHKDHKDHEVRLTGFSHLVMFRGYLTGCCNGKVYYNTTPANEDTWYWKCYDWSPNNLIYMSATTDQKWLWLHRKDNMTFLINSKLEIIQQQQPTELEDTFRVYGNDNTVYLDYHPILGIGNYFNAGKQKIYNDLYSAVINVGGEVLGIGKKDKHKYHGIRLIKQQIYYLRR
jgi:hypothetical protein